MFLVIPLLVSFPVLIHPVLLYSVHYVFLVLHSAFSLTNPGYCWWLLHEFVLNYNFFFSVVGRPVRLANY